MRWNACVWIWTRQYLPCCKSNNLILFSYFVKGVWGTSGPRVRHTSMSAEYIYIILLHMFGFNDISLTCCTPLHLYSSLRFYRMAQKKLELRLLVSRKQGSTHHRSHQRDYMGELRMQQHLQLHQGFGE